MIRAARFVVVSMLLLAALTLAVAAPASAAGLAPLLTVAGLINTGSLGTYITCTNTDAVPVSIGVDVFNQGGTMVIAAASNAVSVSSQATIMFGTQTANGLQVDVLITGFVITKGGAVIETTSKKIACSAFLADPSTNPPVSMTTLTIVAKGKQKGD